MLNKDDNEDNIVYTENTIPTKSMPICLQSQNAAEMFIEFFENSGTINGVFKSLSIIKVNLEDLKVKSIQHTTGNNSKLPL
jgi:tellurite resistance-related uncharacterized protein